MSNPARCVPDEVKSLLIPGGNFKKRGDTSVLNSPIRVASRIIDRVVQCASSKGIIIDSGTAKDMEIAFAAHMYTRLDPTYKSRSTLSASGTTNTDGSEFLQIALELDPTGVCLHSIVNTLKVRSAGGANLQTRPSDKTPYDVWDPGVVGGGLG